MHYSRLHLKTALALTLKKALFLLTTAHYLLNILVMKTLAQQYQDLLNFIDDETSRNI